MHIRSHQDYPNIEDIAKDPCQQGQLKTTSVPILNKNPLNVLANQYLSIKRQQAMLVQQQEQHQQCSPEFGINRNLVNQQIAKIEKHYTRYLNMHMTMFCLTQKRHLKENPTRSRSLRANGDPIWFYLTK